MTIITSVPTTLRNPQTFHQFIYQTGGHALVPLPQRLIMIGTMKGGVGVAGTIYPIDSSDTAESLFGVGTSLTLMCRKGLDCAAYVGGGPQFYAVGVIEPGGGAARTQTLTITGTATGSGLMPLTVKGLPLNVPINVGDNPTTIATAVVNEVNRIKNLLPVTAAAVAGVVTFTGNHKGVWGQDIVFRVSTLLPAGVTAVFAAGVAGTGVSDQTAALASIAGPEYDIIANENHATADIALQLAHNTVAWGPSEKKWRWGIFGEPGSIGTATTIASAANDKTIIIANCEQCDSLPGEIATGVGVAWTAKTQPNGNWDRMKIPLAPPPQNFDFTTTQCETALGAGLTPLKAVSDPQSKIATPGIVQIVKMVTTSTTIGGQPSEVLRDAAISRVGAFVARQIDAKFVAQFGADADPQGALATDDALLKVRDLVSDILYICQSSKILKNVDNDLKKLVVEYDASAPGRVNIDVTYTVVVGLHQAVFVHRVTVGN